MESDYGTAFLFFIYIFITIIFLLISNFKDIGTKQLNRRI